MDAPAALFSEDQADLWIASPRFAPFLSAAGDDHAVATQLYVWNARLASACFEVIHHLEVLVRNAMHRELRAAEHDGALRSWLIDPKVVRDDEAKAIKATIDRIQQRGKPLTENRVVGGLSFGIWPALLATNYEQLWKETLHRAFPHGSGLRRDIAGPLNRVHQLRNSVAHHEAIFEHPIPHRYRDVLTVAGAVDPHAVRWIDDTSQVLDLWMQRPLH